ncbi:bifunctional helix-turn-helix transcriptional regulator/GNAT family N-acetyltransferase [Granulicella arctica]|uniref:DNA-binding MarR family transcriptional regulator/N-acetylglutamate synthase-like GNAT family acetyltransferase n=1 Tax=Granulicella arctica TaxID=940613 RepID=A0A7Y9PFZ0_9BACT|nr:bifunctional helix-turn-helix transcriptional regulator/GNAT family N-acetyltransferase [Granulicella arctica]NYF78426.1 DNA-binding MarR family transcriptional regulator/N-acetylglutamate synthase-like GNAT family acetyltransferase [Granulicella arctica]
MVLKSIQEEKQISAVREFNRFYTARLGLLRKRHLGGDLSLTEARILYEIGASPRLTASLLRETLGLNAGYISRSLTLLTKRKLVRQTLSKQDGREKLLTLSAAGESSLAWLNEQSALQIQVLLAHVHSKDREALVEALSKVRSILSEPEGPSIRIVRLSESNDDALRLLEEYYVAVSVVQRDTPEAIQRIIDAPGSGMWLAYLDEKAVGCVVLRELGSVRFAGECKRLYVQPVARGHHIADRLLDAQEDFARSKHLRWIYLDSYDDLKAAIALYRKRGYVSCERYNDNPQATVFLRKDIGLGS